MLSLAMKQTSRVRRGVLVTGLAMGGLVGCATQASLAPPPSAAQVNTAETAVKVAREGGRDGSAGKHVQLAERQLAEARERMASGDNRGAGLALARAEVDAELSQVLRKREKALADAELIEGQLADTRRAQPADPTSKTPPPPLPNTAPPGAVAPGPMPNDPLAGTTSQGATPATALPTPATSAPPSTALPPTSPTTVTSPPARPSGPPPEPTRTSPPDNKTPTIAPGPSGPGTGIPTGPAGTGSSTP